MLSTKNKVKITDIFSMCLIEKLENINYGSKWVITEDIHVQLESGVVSNRTDMKSLYEEGDINIIKQWLTCVKNEIISAKIICKDTDLFS